MKFKPFVVSVGFKLLGMGLVSVSKIEPAVKKELQFYEDGFVIELKVFITNTKVAVKKMGFKFVGSTIIYAFMQATGMVNDHEIGCFRYSEV